MLGQTWLWRFRPNSYIPTFLHSYLSAVRAPGHIRYAYRSGQKPGGGAQSDLNLAAGPGVGMYECTNPTHSFFPKPSIRARETRIFVHSYVLTLTDDRRRPVRSACTAVFYCLLGLAVATVCTTT